MTLNALFLIALTQSQQAVPPLVSAAWLAEHLNDPSVVVIHVDSRPERYAEGHIPGARFVRYDAIANDGGGLGAEIPDLAALENVLEAAGVNDDSHVVIYSVTRVLQATRLWFTLDYLGHGGRTSMLDGGMAQWRAESRPVTNQAAVARRGSFTPRPRPEVLVTADWIHQRLEDPKLVLIDARPDDEYTGADGGMGGAVHPGHIPGAYQLYWEKLVESADRPTFLPLPELRRQFEAGGAGEDKTVVTYCMIGMRASLTYFVGRLLGYDMKFYDGSWHEWGARDLPHVTGTAPR